MVLSPYKNQYLDPVWHNLLKEVKSDIPIVLVTRHERFEFNEDLYKLDKYVLCCGCEYGWNAPLEKTRTHLWGYNTELFNGFDSDEWKKFDEFVNTKSPLMLFKRELLKEDASSVVVPLNYPCWHPIPPIQSLEAFNARPLLFNFVWGLSHEYRKDLHGQIWQQAGKHDYVVSDNISWLSVFLENEKHPKKVLTQNVPYYARYNMKDIIAINGLSKISISLGGAGRHCFRDSESPINSGMYRWEDNIKFSYDWVHGVNCIKSKQGKEIETIFEALNNPSLYEVYEAGVENCRKYFLPDYATHIEKIIKEVCG